VNRHGASGHRERNKTILAEKKLKNGIMTKAARNKPLSLLQHIVNRLISSVRDKVERSIGTLL